MAADLAIHVFKDGELTDADFRGFFGNTLCSKWFGGFGRRNQSLEEDTRYYNKFAALPSVHVGEVSWLKAALTGDGDKYIPGPVEVVNSIIDESYPVIDDALIERVRSGLSAASNSTTYATAESDEIVAFLEKNKGLRALTVSW